MLYKIILIYQILLFVYYLIKDILQYNIKFSDLIKRFYYNESSKIDVLINAKSVGESKAILPLIYKLEKKKINFKLCVNLPEGYYFIKKYTNKVFLKPYNTLITTLLLLIKLRPKVIISPNGDFKCLLYMFGKLFGSKIYFINYFINNKGFNIRHNINYLLADQIYLSHKILDKYKKYSYIGDLKLLYSSESILNKSKYLTLIIASASYEEIDVHIKYIKYLISNYEIKIIYVPRYLNWLNKFKNKINNIDHQFINDIYNDNEINSSLIICWKIGVLNKLYNKSHICLMGNTFTKIGGHNLVEPSINKNAILTGPNTKTCQNQCDILNVVKNKNFEELIYNTNKIIKNKLYINMGFTNYNNILNEQTNINNNLDLFINKISY